MRKAAIPRAVVSSALEYERYLARGVDFPANDEAGAEKKLSKEAVAQLLQEVEQQRATTA
jgi:transposase